MFDFTPRRTESPKFEYQVETHDHISNDKSLILISYENKNAIRKYHNISEKIEFDRKSAVLLTQLINKKFNTNHRATDLPLM
jgi:hypothetical protein